MQLGLGQQLSTDSVAQVRTEAEREQRGHERGEPLDGLNVPCSECLLGIARLEERLADHPAYGLG